MWTKDTKKGMWLLTYNTLPASFGEIEIWFWLLIVGTKESKINKWLNIIFGTIYTAIIILIALTSIAPWWTFYVFLAIVESGITLLIILFAWNWPKQNKVTK